ncbi:uncharacterized protein LOC111614038 [Centruroides sculpturatus]|uniref:uncharacterized protein LOC111614038 n=1 Tax=Centruroides sculpturatus TaxID=218467 RepID=UPI000C6E95EE|nr:uncharacterized protein LOC111614038 [Centruroides sculpturatus]
MGGHTIKLDKTIKYLGVILDHRLLWNSHIEYITKRTGKIFNAFASIARGRWGHATEAMDAIYNQIYIPIITYACGIWEGDVYKTHIKRKLISSQRRALIQITKAYNTTPNISIQVLAKKAPIDLIITTYFKQFQIKHGLDIYISNQQIRHIDLEQEISFAIYSQSLALSYTPSIVFEQPSYNDYEIFTDGSKTDIKVGCSYVVYQNGQEIALGQFRLGEQCTIFQEELYALKMAITWANNVHHKQIAIITDSSSSIAILRKGSFHPIVYDINTLISKSSNRYYIYWTRAQIFMILMVTKGLMP